MRSGISCHSLKVGEVLLAVVLLSLEYAWYTIISSSSIIVSYPLKKDYFATNVTVPLKNSLKKHSAKIKKQPLCKTTGKSDFFFIFFATDF